MNDHPSIAALQGKPALQRRAQSAVVAAKAAWLSGSAKVVLKDLELFSEGADLEQCRALQKATRRLDFADPLISDLVDQLCPALGHAPLAQIPFRHQYQDGLGVLRLAESGNAALSLVSYEERAQSAAQTICFSDSETYEIVLAGQATGQKCLLDKNGSLVRTPLRMGRGICVSLHGDSEAKLVEDVAGRMVVLRLSRSPESPADSREYRLSDGKLIHRASGNRKDSRLEMAMALLGAMEREDAAEHMSCIAVETSHALRWQALRQCLALDTATGFARLSAMALDPTDPLHDQAGSLRAQLLGSYPQLAKLERQLCPA